MIDTSNISVRTTTYPNTDDTTLADNAGQAAGTSAGGVSRAGDQIIIDVKSGDATTIAGLDVSLVGRTSNVASVVLTAGQQEDVDRLLGLLGLDCENAKDATAVTILQAIQQHIKAQRVSVTTTTSAMSDYDVQRLTSLKAAMETMKGDYYADLVAGNVSRMLELKNEIEDLTSIKGMTYDGNFEGSVDMSNFELNTRVREMGDRIADIRTYTHHLDSDSLDAALDTLAPAMKTAVTDLLSAYDKTSGWGVQVNITYAQMTRETVHSLVDTLKSPDLTLPDQIDRDALVKMLEKLEESAQTAEEIEKKLEELIAELQETLTQIETGRSDAPETV